MHSNVIHISKDKNASPNISYCELDNLKSINYAIDYFDEDLISTEEVMNDNNFEGLLPDFITMSPDGTIKVSENSKIACTEWSENFIKRMRQWQNMNRKRLGFHALSITDINTNDENPENWYHVDLIFNVMIDDDDNNFSGYLDFITDLAYYHQGETLYVVGAQDFHY